MEKTFSQIQRNWIVGTLSLLFLVSLLGLTMRYMFVVELPFKYKHILHAHSHTALMGFGFLLVMGGFLFYILRGKMKRTKKYRSSLWIFLGAIIAMALSFLYQGYGMISIGISTFLLLYSMYVLYLYKRDYDSIREQRRWNPFVKWSIWWYFFSAIGLLAIPFIVLIAGKTHELYYMAVQFFLHFQFNGWFTYAVLAIFIYYMRQKSGRYEVNKVGFYLLNASVILTFLLSVTFYEPISVLFYINSLGVLLQLVAVYLILKPIIYDDSKAIDSISTADLLIGAGILSLILKVLIQAAVAIPVIAVISYTIHNYVIGFIHLILLGSITMTTVGILLKVGVLPLNKISSMGWKGFLGTFIITEFILFLQGTLLWMKFGFVQYYYEILFGFTILFPISIITILLGTIKGFSNSITKYSIKS